MKNMIGKIAKRETKSRFLSVGKDFSDPISKIPSAFVVRAEGILHKLSAFGAKAESKSQIW